MPRSRLSANITALKKGESVSYSLLPLRDSQFVLRVHSTLVQTIIVKNTFWLFCSNFESLLIILQLKGSRLMPLVQKSP